jgi:cysteine synthase
MSNLGLEREVVDAAVLAATVERFGAVGGVLPTLAQLADPATIPQEIVDRLTDVDPDAADPANLFRVHWHNGADRRSRVDVPEHVVLPPELTGVESPIIVVFGDRFPMISAHKVLAAYGCLVPRLVTGRFDPSRHRAIWPSTGNYCRGGVAISKILGCRGVAVLPEGMSAERFAWLDDWIIDPSDVIKTPGTESNVKEIYDKCAELSADPDNFLFNQFCEFGNHVAHWLVTGQALERVFEHVAASRPGLELMAFTSATGSAGTIAAGDHLKDRYGTRIVAVEAQECPTMLCNGFGEHNIQGIGDKHIPLIHNVMNTDVVSAVSDRSTDSLNVLFNTDTGRRWLARERGFSDELLDALSHCGLSSLCNVLAAIQLGRHWGLGPDKAIITVATDGAAMYASEVDKSIAKLFPGGFDEAAAAATFDEHITQVGDQYLQVLRDRDRERIFNLGYFTWVEQQGLSLADFEVRRSQEFWVGLRELVPVWDGLIDSFNGAAGAAGRDG